MSFISYSRLNSLPEISFIGGTEYTLIYNCYDENGSALDLGGASVYVAICPYGQSDYTIIQKTGTITATSQFKAVLTGDDTRGLYGKYIHQPVIISFTGSEYRPAQGVILVLNSITLN